MVSLIAILSAVALVLGLAYSKEQSVFIEQLKQQAMILAATMEDTIPEEDVKSLEKLSRDIHGNFENRITYVGADGTVLYDNKADVSEMENHNQREEIIAARESGTGSAVRQSHTLSQMTVYCARMIGYGCIVRVSGTMDTVFARMLGMWWEILIIVAAAAVVSMGVSALVARAVVKPINNIDLKNPDIGEGYNEIAPLLHRLKEQNREIDRRIAELTSSRKEFTLITENMSEGLIITDSRAEALTYNTAAEKMLGSSFTGESRSVLVLNRTEDFRRAVRSGLDGKRCEVSLTVSGRVYQGIVTPVFTDGSVTGTVIIILDITEREQREELRREFTSNVSHELKTPLTTIYGIADLLVSGMVKPEDIHGFAVNIHNEAARMVKLIEDIINLSQLDENKFTAEKKKVDLLEMAQIACERLRPAAEKMHVTVTVTGDHTQYVGIAPVLDEIVFNLMENAIKYNKQGGRADIEVTDSDSKVVMTFSDNGVGIPADSVDRIFERFYRVDKSHSRRIGGTGLGLSIVKHGVSLHGGTVTVSSVEGCGSTFTVTLPKN